MDPWEVFPDLVWEELLKRVESYVDRISILRSHRALEERFESKINEWRSLAVIQICVKKMKNTEFLQLARSHLLSLRLAAKSTCYIVDKSTKSRWNNCASAPFNEYYCRTYRTMFTCGFRVRSFNQMFEDHPPNRSPVAVAPFMIFEVPFDNSRFPDMTEEERLQVVLKAGPHLKGLCLELDIHHPENSIERSRVLVELILSLTPNLVHVSFPGIHQRRLIDDEDLMQQLQSTAKLNLPELPFLRYLQIGIKAKPALVDFLGLEKYFPQLTRLTLMLDHWKEEYSTRAADIFPNLQYLSFQSPEYLHYLQPSYLRILSLPEFRTKLINIYKMQAPKIKRFYFEIIHNDKEVLKSIVRVETRNGLTYLRKRFEGQCYWKCKIIAQWHDRWRFSLFRTNKTDTEGGEFPDENLEKLIERAIRREENEERQRIYDANMQERNEEMQRRHNAIRQELNEVRIRNEITRELFQERLREIRQENEERIRRFDEQRIQNDLEKKVEEEVKGDSCVKTVLKFASAATAILSVGVVLAKRLNK